MAETWNGIKIKTFVKDTLGCGCPEKVFEKIDVSKRRMQEHAVEITRIVVGDTLLIYIIHAESVDDQTDFVVPFGTAGKNDRDTQGFNRFRLVVTDDGNLIRRDKVTECFARSFSSDEKMHLHFVDEEMIAALST